MEIIDWLTSNLKPSDWIALFSALVALFALAGSFISIWISVSLHNVAWKRTDHLPYYRKQEQALEVVRRSIVGKPTGGQTILPTIRNVSLVQLSKDAEILGLYDDATDLYLIDFYAHQRSANILNLTIDEIDHEIITRFNRVYTRRIKQIEKITKSKRPFKFYHRLRYAWHRSIFFLEDLMSSKKNK